VVDVTSGKIEATFNHKGKIADLAWSPDGKRVAVIGAESIHDPSAGRLKVGKARGGALVDLLPKGFEGDTEAVAFSDTDTLVYIVHEGMLSKLMQVEFDGSGRRPLVDAEAPILRSMSLSRESGRIAIVGDTPKHPRELFHLDAGAGEVARITDSNPWLSELRLGKQEIVRYKARDGEMIEGLLFRPLDEKPGERYPLILVVHGGPEAHYSKGWVTRYSSPGHYGAARGFAVFYPNYRGSTGRGVEFSMAGQGDYAGAEFNDLVDGIAHLADEMKLIDRKRVGITGGSYGGFAAAWGATALTEHFAASVMFVGISEQISKFGTTDIPNEMYLVHARSWPWERWDFYKERSPVFHAQKSKTPTLILHGKEDTRVHPSQSMILYRFMKTLGKTVRLVHYPGEGHGNRKAAARHDYRLRMMRWMEHYLLGPGGDPPPPHLELELGDTDEKSAESGH
jgi:dipeptidyl aminopeptidase/acylaminoacyl peptidase